MDVSIKNDILNQLRARVRSLFGIKISGIGLEKLVNVDKSLVKGPVYHRGHQKRKETDYLNLVSWNIATGDKFDDIVKYFKGLEESLGEIDILLLQEVGINLPEINS